MSKEVKEVKENCQEEEVCGNVLIPKEEISEVRLFQGISIGRKFGLVLLSSDMYDLREDSRGDVYVGEKLKVKATNIATVVYK